MRRFPASPMRRGHRAPWSSGGKPPAKPFPLPLGDLYWGGASGMVGRVLISSGAQYWAKSALGVGHDIISLDAHGDYIIVGTAQGDVAAVNGNGDLLWAKWGAYAPAAVVGVAVLNAGAMILTGSQPWPAVGANSGPAYRATALHDLATGAVLATGSLYHAADGTVLRARPQRDYAWSGQADGTFEPLTVNGASIDTGGYHWVARTNCILISIDPAPSGAYAYVAATNLAGGAASNKANANGNGIVSWTGQTGNASGKWGPMAVDPNAQSEGYLSSNWGAFSRSDYCYCGGSWGATAYLLAGEVGAGTQRPVVFAVDYDNNHRLIVARGPDGSGTWTGGLYAFTGVGVTSNRVVGTLDWIAAPSGGYQDAPRAFALVE